MSRVIEVFHIENDLMYFDFFLEKSWKNIVNNFFIEGGLTFPEKINQNKSLEELTDSDYISFFEEIGYEFVSFNEYDSSRPIDYVIKIPNEKEIAQS